MIEPPLAFPGQQVIGEPRRLRHELAWTIALPDGRRAVIAQLAPELAAEPTLRRRFVADMERLAALPASRLAPTLAIGPAPDPRAAHAAPPWRVRLDPPGQVLDELLQRAPLPLDEAIEVGVRLAEAVQTFHAAGAVLRDLDPRSIVIGGDGLYWFTDVGHARLAILSSRTASSLLLESSPYAAPEALLETIVDARAVVYSLGVVLWRALTGRLPFEASLLASRTALPRLADVRADVPPELANLVARCLERAPEHRPPTARDVAASLSGRGTDVALVVARKNCQACGAAMRVGLRLCLACGKQSIQFHLAAPEDLDAEAIVLRKASEDAVFVAGLQAFFEPIAVAVPKLNFVVGDSRMYSKTELAQRHRMPAVLVAGLEPATSKALVARLAAGGFKIRTVTPRQTRRRLRRLRGTIAGSAVTFVAAIVALAVGGGMAVLGGVGMSLAMAVGALGAIRYSRAKKEIQRVPLAQLRAAPAALPAADVLVATIAAALTAARSPDVRARVEELALLVQRLCDAKAAIASADPASRADVERVTGPVRPLVELARQTSAAIDAIDDQLSSLDEGAIVRALARCDARGEAPALRQDLLAGLDTLRQLEEERGTLFGRLLEITSLLRTAVARGLAHAAELRSTDVEVAHALAALDD
ncbi:MAG: protein kinase [Kofleriaceae bacterium]